MKRACLIFCAAFSTAQAAVWVGYDGGLAQYTDAGEFVHRFDNYRRPVSLILDRERRRLWFIDAYDYKLVCFDVDAGAEVFAVAAAAHSPDIGTTDLKLYLSDKRPIEPSLALDGGDGGVWLADFFGHQVAKYDAAGKEIFRSGAFHEPFAAAALGDGFAWVAGGVRTLNLVGPDGKSALSQSGVNEARALGYDATRGLAVVADYRNNRILGVDRSGRMKRRVTGVELPFALAVDAARGVVWVATDYERVKKISLDNEEIAATVGEQESIAALALDGEGRVWVAYGEAGEVVCYSPAGEKVASIAKVKKPTGVAAE